MKYFVFVFIILLFNQLRAFSQYDEQVSQTANLIINGGFESGINGWETWNNPRIINSDVAEGNSAVMMVEKGSVSQIIKVQPLTTYVVSAKSKISHSDAKLVFAVEGISTIDVEETAYTKHAIQFTTDEKTTNVKVYFWLPPNEGIGSSLLAFVDGVEMKELDEETQFNITERSPENSTQIEATDSLSLIFNKEVSLETSNDIDVYVNKELANESCTWTVSSSNVLSVHPQEKWSPGSLISIKVNSTSTAKNGLEFNGIISEFEYIVDTENSFGFEKIEIPTLVTRNNGRHNIPLKVALPTDRSNQVPVQFWVHGGGWSGGTETDSWAYYGPHSEYLAEELGIATLEIAYRCRGSNGTFAQALEDIDAAYQWAVDNAEKYNLDIRNSFFSGGSAGTPLSSLAAQRYPEIKAYVGFNGIYNFVENPNSSFPAPDIYEYCIPSCEANSSLFNLRENPPITLLLHGDQDGTINHTQSTLFAEAVVNAGGKAKAIIYEGESHAFFNPGKVQYEDCMYEMSKFLRDNDIIQRVRTGIWEEASVQHPKIWPNPASKSISISTDNLNGKTKILIFNAEGNPVLRTVIDDRGKESMTLYLDGLPIGYYILNLRDETGVGFSHILLLK